MLVALATADNQNFVAALRMSGDQGLTDIVPFVYLLFLAWLATAGPGPLSLDALLGRWLGVGKPSTKAATKTGPLAPQAYF
jgi:hypothetical protein